MRIYAFFVLPVFVAVFSSQAGGVVPAECSKALITNSTGYQSDTVARYAMIELVTESSYEELRQNGTIGSIFDDLEAAATWDEFQERAREYRRSFSSDLAVKDYRSYATHYLSPEGAKAFSDCVRQHNPEGVAIWAEQVSDAGASVIVRWVAPMNTVAAGKLDFFVQGGETTSPVQTNFQGNYEQVISIQRGRDEDLRIVANINGRTDSLYIPRRVKFKENVSRIEVSSQNTPTSQDAGGCFGKRCSGESMKGNVVCKSAPPGYTIQVAPVLTVTKRWDNRGVGTQSRIDRVSPLPRGEFDAENWQPGQTYACYMAYAIPTAKEAQTGVSGYFAFTAEKVQHIPE